MVCICSLTFFITKALNSFSGKLFISVSLFIFSGIFLLLFQSRAISLPFLSVRIFVRQVPITVLKVCSYVRASFTDCMCQMPLVGELGLTWRQVISFPRVCWQLSPWVGGEAGDGGARAGAGSEAGLPLCSVVITTLLVARSGPK